VKEKLTWFDNNGQEFYFDYKIGKPMKEKDAKAIENCTLEQLFTMDGALPLYEQQGQDVTEVRGKIWKVINKKLNEGERPYLHASQNELVNLRMQMQVLEEREGFNMSALIEPLDREIRLKSESGIIYDAGSEGVDLAERKKV